MPTDRWMPADQESIMFELESRSNDATAAIARLLARQTNAPLNSLEIRPANSHALMPASRPPRR